MTKKDYEATECLKKTHKLLSSDIGLYWLQWEKLSNILFTYLTHNITSGEKVLINDLLNFLNKRNLIIFTGIKHYIGKYFWKYKIKRNYSFGIKFSSFNWRYIHE